MSSAFRLSAWGYQHLSLLFSLVCLAALIILLIQFDQKPVFTWQGVTLNAIVSILSVTIRAALAYVVSECLAQWKWILFWREERKLLIDFDRIDSATRGPLGSLRVLLRTKGAMAVQFGAILSLLAVAMDPFAPQLIQLRQESIFVPSTWQDPSHVALNSRAPSYSLGTAVSTRGTFKDNTINFTLNYYYSTTELPLSMQAAILNGLSRSPGEVDQEALLQCSTSNCTWDQFTTLGICHRCNDLTSELKRVEDFGGALAAIADSGFHRDAPSTAFALPNGHFIANVDGCPPYNGRSADCENGNPSGMYVAEKYGTTSFGTGNPNRTVTMKDIDSLLWSMSIIYPDLKALNASTFTPGELGTPNDNLKFWPEIPMKATECALYYRVKNVDSSLKVNVLSETVTEASGSRRHPESWIREDGALGALPGSILPPPDEITSLEFNKNWSSVSYSPLVIDFPGNKSETDYYISESSIKSLSAYMQQLFLANWTGGIQRRAEVEKRLGKGAVGFNGASFGPFDDTLKMKAIPTALNGVWSWKRPDTPRLFYTLATSMTNEMRRNWDTQESKHHIMKQDGNGQNVMGTLEYRGKVGILTVVYEIQWGWITLDVVVSLSVMMLLALTIWNSKAHKAAAPLWKSSSLAALRHGRVVGAVFESTNTIREMEEKARKSYVKVPTEDSDENTTWINMTELERERVQ